MFDLISNCLSVCVCARKKRTIFKVCLLLFTCNCVIYGFITFPCTYFHTGPELELPAGRNVYPVEFTLPLCLPSSFQGLHGGVHYTIKAKIQADGDFTKSLKEEFHIESPLDLNLYPLTKEQQKIEEIKYFCCWCCRSGPLTLVTTVPRTGYLPGEKINFLVECDNTSRIDVLSVKLFLREIQTYRSTTPRINTKVHEELVAEFEFLEGVKSMDTKTYKGELSIPHEKVKNLKNCTLIDVDYEVYVIAEVNKLHMDLENKLPITLGNIAFATTPSDVIVAHNQIKPKTKSGSIPFIDSTE